MSESNIYYRSCSVLLQAILTQACRTIFAFCIAVSKNILLDRRVLAIANSYVLASEALSFVEYMDKHILLTAVHLLCCEYRPHMACHHYHGEIAAAVGTVLEDSSLCSNLLSALTEFIIRKWRHNKNLIQNLLSRALSVGPIEHTVVVSAPESMVSPMTLLLQVYPELAHSGVSVEVTCGCPHQWFRETLPIILLEASMDRHARTWQRTSILQKVFLRWRQRHGMCLLKGLAAGNSPPPLDVATKAPSTVQSEHDQWASMRHTGIEFTPSSVENNNSNNQSRSLQQSSVEECAEGGTALQPVVVAVTDAPSSEIKTTPTKMTVAECNGKLLKTFLLECDKLALVRIKRHTFWYWRDVRLVERLKLKHMLDELMWRIKRRHFTQWRWRLECHCIAKRKKFAEEQYCDFVGIKNRRFMHGMFTRWRVSFMVKQFCRRTCGRRFFAMWRRAYTFAIHASGKVRPFVSDRALAARCLGEWREKYCSRKADRMCIRLRFFWIINQLRRRSEFLHYDGIAKTYAGHTLQRRCLKLWRKRYKLHYLCAQFVRRSERRFLYHVLLFWHICWIRQIGGNDRMNTFHAVRRQRLIVFTFTCWFKKTQLCRLHRQWVEYRRKSTYCIVWSRWTQRAAFYSKVHKDRLSLALLVYQRFTLRRAWHLWLQRCVTRERNRYAVDEATILRRAQTMRAQRLLATVWFTWKGKAHLMRHRRQGAVLSPCRTNTSLGVNHSFPQPVMSTSGVPGRRAVNPNGLSVSFTGSTRSPLRRDPLAAIRAERVLLRGLHSAQWQTMAHSRLFNTSSNSNSSKVGGGGGGGGRNHRRSMRGCREEITTVIMMPSDIEDDNSPSVDNSHTLL